MQYKKALAILMCITMLLCAVPALAASRVTVTVKYVTGDKNTRIADSEKITGEPGDYFQVNIKDIKGYTFIGFTHNEGNNFVFPNENITMLAHYAKASGVTVKYVDEKGNKLGASQTISGHEGDSYTVDTPYFAGYAFLRVDDPNGGVIRAKNSTVKVIYSANTGVVVPPSGTMQHLTVKSVDQGTGAVLNLLVNKDVPYGTKINISDYKHDAPGHTFTGVMVNGVAPGLTEISVTRDTTVVYYYQTKSHWTQPITHDSMLLVRGVDEATGCVIREFYNQAVSYGSAMALNPPAVHGYAYDYYTVSGAQAYNGIITIYNDAVVTYFYRPTGGYPVPVIGGDIPTAVIGNTGPAIGSGAIPNAVVGY